MRQPWNGGRTQQVHTRGVRVINPNVTVGPSTSAASILNEGLNKAGRRREQVIAATGSNGAVANPLCSATIHTLLPGAGGRPNPSPDQTSARPSVGACSRQTTSVDPRAHLRSGIAMSFCGKNLGFASRGGDVVEPPRLLVQVGHQVRRVELARQSFEGDPSSDRRFQLGTDRQFAVSHCLELNTWLEFNT